MMSKNQMAHGLPSLKQPRKICEGCLLSKQARTSFPSQSNFTAKVVLELIHEDLGGPISPHTPAGNIYFMFLVDDHSRMMWAYILKTKDEALTAFKKFKMLVENGTSQRIQVFRTDRGGEFFSK